MKQYFVRIPFLLFLVLTVGFVSCSKDNDLDDPDEYSYFKEVTSERRVSKAEIIAGLDAQFPGLNIGSSSLASLINDVEVAAITYHTKGVDGEPTVASGVVVVPSGSTSYNHLLSIQHSTLDLEEAPSRSGFYYEMAPAVVGHIVVMADYLGYGASQTSDRQHPYLHIPSTGVVCADMIEAAREYLHSKEFQQQADSVELMGYSQGGTSTLATLLELEKRGLASSVRAVHAGGGAYDLTGTLNAMISAATSNYPRMGYIPYLIRGMSYGEQIQLDDRKIYTPELISKGLTAMFSTKPLSEWHEPLGKEVAKVLHPDFFAPPMYNHNADIAKLVAALDKNSLAKYPAPITPVQLYHSRLDDFVPYSNSTAVKANWSNATLTTLTLPGHVLAGMEFMLRYMGLWELVGQK